MLVQMLPDRTTSVRRTLVVSPDFATREIALAYDNEGNQVFIQHAKAGDTVIDRYPLPDYYYPLYRARIYHGDGESREFSIPQWPADEIPCLFNACESIAAAFITGQHDLLLNMAETKCKTLTYNPLEQPFETAS